MDILSFETPKAGIEDFRNEDSIHVRQINDDLLMALVSDGASTGVFSKEWSDHITHSFDTKWFHSVEDFEYGLNTIRETFKPNITRQTALRKFLMEGSYATLLACLVEKDKSWFSSKLKLNLYAIGDVCVFIFSENRQLTFTFPYTCFEDFNNIPHLIRTSVKLQAKTPYEIRRNSLSIDENSLIVIASDAISEYLFQMSEKNNIFETLQEIVGCQDNHEFKKLVTAYRDERHMKNDDVAVCFLAENLERYFPGMSKS